MEEVTSIGKRNIFWMDDPTILYSNGNYLSFFPQSEMTRAEQLNSLTRFCIYLIILMILFYGSTKWLYIPIIGIIMIIILYYIYKNDPEGKDKELYRQKGEKFDSITHTDKNKIYELESGFYDSDGLLRLGQEFNATSPHPYKKINYDMNEMLEYQKATCRKPTSDNPFMNPPITDFNNGDVPVACNVDDEEINNTIKNSFDDGLFRNIENLFDNHNSQRMFYTIPSPSVPSDQPAFANWLYGDMDNCKTNQQLCLEYEPEQFKR